MRQFAVFALCLALAFATDKEDVADDESAPSGASDCSDDCYDVHRDCRAIVNSDDEESDAENSPEQQYLLKWKNDNKDQGEDYLAEFEPSCDKDFYINRCFRTCGVCTPCDCAHAEDLEAQMIKEQEDYDELKAELDLAMEMLAEFDVDASSMQNQINENNDLINGALDRLPVLICKSDDDCENGGTCDVIDNSGDTECICADGWLGELCTQDFNECAENANYCTGAPSTCVNELGSARCDCESPFYTENGSTRCIGSTSWETSSVSSCALYTGIITTSYTRTCYDVCSDESKQEDAYNCWGSHPDGTFYGAAQGTFYRFNTFTRRLRWIQLRTGDILDGILIYQDGSDAYKLLGGWGGGLSCNFGVPTNGLTRVGITIQNWWWVDTVKRLQFYDASGNLYCNYGSPGYQVYAPSNCILGGTAGWSDGYVRRYGPTWNCL
jgi:hypothetical protein